MEFLICKGFDWRCRGVVVITNAQLHSTKPETRFCAGSNPAHGVSGTLDGEYLGKWSRLEIRLNAFRRSTIPQKQFIITIIKYFMTNFFSTHYKHFYLISCFHNQRSYFVAYTLLRLISHKTDM